MSKKSKSRNLTQKESIVLYGLSAGRCNICNTSVLKHELTGSTGNYGQMAHIVDHSLNHAVRSKEDLKLLEEDGFAFNRVINVEEWDTSGLENIILLCHKCHWEADKVKPINWPIETLLEYKKQHESRAYQQTEASKNTFLIEYYSMIDDYNPKSSSHEIRKSLTRHSRFEEHNELLGNTNRIFADHEDDFWGLEEATLDKHYADWVSRPREDRQFEHFSIFAMATQPLLIKLGALLGSKHGIQVFPCNRDSDNSWGWYHVSPAKFSYATGGAKKDSTPIIQLRISGSKSMSSEAITKYLQTSKLDVFSIEVEDECTPGRQWAESDNDQFRQTALSCINAIHEKHGNKPIHVFPALPNHLAVEFGRASLEKVHPDMIIHDYNHKSNGWRKGIEINRTVK